MMIKVLHTVDDSIIHGENFIINDFFRIAGLPNQ